MRMRPGAASFSRREARFTTSPMIVYSLRVVEPTFPVTASPACSPIRIRVGAISPLALIASTFSMISNDAATAFRLSRASEIGAPNTAMKPSPRNLFTIP
jgi:hypothetical protein